MATVEEANDPELVEGPTSLSWFVYICKSAAGHYYVGISLRPRDRVDAHNSGVGAKMARDQGNFTLLYTSRAYATKSLARKRELQIKRWSRFKKEKLINGEWI